MKTYYITIFLINIMIIALALSAVWITDSLWGLLALFFMVEWEC